jgi:hypothetical protein
MRKLLPVLAGALTICFSATAHAVLPAVEAEKQGCDPIDPSVCLYPFPNDYFTVGDAQTATGRRVNLPLSGMPRNVAGKPIEPADWNRADGFSPGSPIITKVPGLDTQVAFERTGAVPITDMARTYDADQPVVVIDADTLERHLIWSEIDSNPADPKDRMFLIRPGVNFEEGHRYIVALRNLKDANGNTIPASAAFRSFRDEVVGNARGRRAHMEEVFATLEQAGIARGELYLAWDFTVASADSLAGRMLHIRDDAFAKLGDTNLADLTVQGSAPRFSVRTVTDYTPAQDGRIARRVEGTFEVPCYLTAGANCSPGTRFAWTTGDTPAHPVAGTYEANFICHIARSTVDGPGVNPARPSLYGHGLLGDAGEIGQSQLKSLGNDHNFVFCATDWDGMSEEDLPVVVGLIIPDLSNFNMLADRVQQGMLNQLFLGRLMIHAAGFSSDPAFQDEGQPVIDRTRLFYDGNSQGAINGGALAAVGVDHERAVLGVPGMNYSTLLQRSSDFVGAPLADVVASGGEGLGFSTLLYESYPSERERQLVFALMQMLWDRAEANGYAQHMTDDPLPNTPAHEVMLHVALGDHQVAPVTAEVEARTIGALALNDPLVGPGRSADVDPFHAIEAFPSFPADGSALVVWDSGAPVPPTTNTANHTGFDPHEHPRRQPAARLQKSEFLKVGGKVVDVCDGLPCLANPNL